MKETEQEKYQNDENESWNELDDFEGKNLDNFNSDEDEMDLNDKDAKSKPNSKVKKAN